MLTDQATSGTAVVHANPELDDWRGTIVADRRGYWKTTYNDDDQKVIYIHVLWHRGPTGTRRDGWFPITALEMDTTS